MPAARSKASASSSTAATKPYSRVKKVTDVKSSSLSRGAGAPASGEIPDASTRIAWDLSVATKDGKRIFTEVDKIDPATVSFPRDPISRSRFRAPGGKVVTPHQWKVYDLLITVPPGRVTTYGIMSKMLGSSAQAVGGALRDNPFAPYIPCHRVIATSLFVGGFQGEWGKGGSTEGKPSSKAKSTKVGSSDEGVKNGRKLRLLEKEGVSFTPDGYLIGGESVLWKGT
ncbi:DNA binding methylated-DNA--cysteine S-methyltransferase [Meredithblackwellia eburnea MCA 4105]